MKCPYCDHADPEVRVLKDEQLVISGARQVSKLNQKADVEVECNHCHAHYLLEFQIEPTGYMLDLS